MPAKKPAAPVQRPNPADLSREEMAAQLKDVAALVERLGWRSLLVALAALAAERKSPVKKLAPILFAASMQADEP